MLYRLSKNQDTPTLHPIPLTSLATAGWSEKNLEDVLANRLDLLLRDTQLMVITQERKWQEEADILAVDVQGTLYIFEIKRTESDQSNLLQVIRYGQIFGQYSYDSLEYLFRQYRRDRSTRLTEAHQSYFELLEPLTPTSFNRRQQFIVVTAGIDTKTLPSATGRRRVYPSNRSPTTFISKGTSSSSSSPPTHQPPTIT